MVLGVLVVLLLLCSWCLLWPVPPSEVGAGRRFVERNLQGGSVKIELLDARAVPGTVGSKGHLVLLSFRLINSGPGRRLDPAHFALQIDDVLLPPLDSARTNVRGSFLPHAVDAGGSVVGSLIFAVPYGPDSATLHLRASGLTENQEASSDVSLPESGLR